jgi:hypothetical protein
LEEWTANTKELLKSKKEGLQEMQDQKFREILFPTPGEDPIWSLVGNRYIINDLEDLKKFSVKVMDYSDCEKNILEKWRQKKLTERIEAYKFFRAEAFFKVFSSKFKINDGVTMALAAGNAVSYKKGTKNYMPMTDRQAFVRRFESAFHNLIFPPQPSTERVTVNPERQSRTTSVSETCQRLRWELSNPGVPYQGNLARGRICIFLVVFENYCISYTLNSFIYLCHL